jgi:hypothetical protein
LERLCDVTRFDAGVVQLRTTIGRGAAADLFEAITVAARETTPFTMRLAPVRELRLAIVDEQGAAVGGARVEIRRMPGPEPGLTYWQTDAEGIVTFEVHPHYDVPVTVKIDDDVVLSTVIAAGVNPPPPLVVNRR